MHKYPKLIPIISEYLILGRWTI